MQDLLALKVPLDPLEFLEMSDHQDLWCMLKGSQQHLFQALRALQEPLEYLEFQELLDKEGREVYQV